MKATRDPIPIPVSRNNVRGKNTTVVSERALQLHCCQVPRIIIKTGLPGPDGREEELREFMCDVPGCPNVAVHVLGVSRELGVFSVVCQEHARGKRP